MADPVASSLATGVSATAITTCSFTSQPAGTLLELNITGDDYIVTTGGTNRPESSGWTLVQNVAGTSFYGQAKWYKLSTGSESSVIYSIGSAARSCWSVNAITNIDQTTPLAISNKVNTNASSTTVASTSPGTPTGAGRCITMASLAGSLSTTVFSGIGAPSNGFSTVSTAQTAATPGLINATCALVGNQGTATPTTTATFGGSVTAQARGAIVAVYNGAAGGTNYTGTPADAEGITDSAAANADNVRAQADPEGITDTASPAQALVRSQADAVGLLDSATTATDYVRSVVDPVGITDSATVSLGPTRSMDDPVGITDSTSLFVTSARTVADPVGVVDAASVVTAGMRAIADALGLTDSVTAAITVAPVFTTVNFTGASGTVPLPSGYLSTDRFLMIVSRNQTATAFSYSSEILTATEIENNGADRRISAHLLTPNGTGQPNFTLTITGTSGVNTVLLANVGSNYAFASPIYHNNNPVGGSTVSAIAIPELYYGFIATGNELVVSAAGTNAAATWTTDATTLYATGSSTNAGLMVDMTHAVAGSLTGVSPAMDRGLSGTTRNQNSLALVLQATPIGVVNYLTNPSFETFVSGLATSWTDEHTTAGAATYTSTASNVTDGTTAQRIQYTGQAGDAAGTAILEIYQAPISASPGQVYTFDIYINGSINTSPPVIGIEAFTSGNVYISEADTSVTSITGTPAKWTVTYTCPAGTDHVAAFFQLQNIGSAASIDVTLDRATLTLAPFVPANVADPLGVTDSATQAADNVRAVSDAVGILDAAAAVAATARTVPDPVGLLDSATAAVDAARSATDPIGLTDSAAASATADRVVADPIGIVDSASATTDFARTISDAEGLSDAVSAAQDQVRSQADPVGISDTAAATAAAARSIADPVGLTDAAASALSAQRTTADPVGITDSVTATINGTDYTANISDAIGITDTGAIQTIDYAEQVDDPIGLTDAASATIGSARTQADALGITDSATTAAAAARAVSDPVGLTDAATAAVDVVRAAADPVGVTDTAAAALGVARAQDDPIGVADAATAAVAAARQVDDPIGISDSVSAQISGAGNVTQSDPVGITDSASSAVAAVRTQADPVGVTDSAAAALTLPRSQDDPVGVTDTVAAVSARITSVSDPVGVSDAALTAVSSDRVITDAAGITDTASAGLDLQRAQVDAVGITDSVTAVITRSATASDPVGLTDSASPAMTAARVVTDNVGISDSATAVITGAHNYVVTINDGIGITDVAVGALPNRVIVVAVTTGPDPWALTTGRPAWATTTTGPPTWALTTEDRE